MLGLMCGTFDPPHLGHLILAETAAEQLGLARVLFLPVGQPTHKSTLTPAVHRAQMTRLAIADNPRFALDLSDINRPGPHYTYSLLPLIQQQHPQQELWLIMGGDSLQDLPRWKEPAQLLAQCQLAVMERPGEEIHWAELRQLFPTIDQTVTLLSGLSMAVSSTLIRQEVKAGRPLRYVLPPAVREYITQQKLYQNE
jgi:nicotinate-nucleotide adenylyltransferase